MRNESPFVPLTPKQVRQAELACDRASRAIMNGANNQGLLADLRKSLDLALRRLLWLESRCGACEHAKGAHTAELGCIAVRVMDAGDDRRGDILCGCDRTFVDS